MTSPKLITRGIKRTRSGLSKSERAQVVADGYFAGPWGSSLTDIGLNLVHQYLQDEPAEEMADYMEATRLPLIKCKICDFVTESSNVMTHHYRTPHFIRSKYRCNFCSEKSTDSQIIEDHMRSIHGIDVLAENPPKKYQCSNCTFEGTQKGQLRRHLVECERKFNLAKNLTIPLSCPLPAYIYNRFKKEKKQKNQAVVKPSTADVQPSTSDVQPSTSYVQPSTSDVQPSTSDVQPSTSDVQPSTSDVQPSTSDVQPSTSDVQPSTAEVQPSTADVQPSLVECEICDDHILNMESLYNHMKEVHKEIVSKEKIIKQKPGNSCTQCHLCFYSKGGLERHYLGSHRLLTSKLKKAYKKKKDCGRCPICRESFDRSGLIDHVSEKHDRNLQVLSISYRCRECDEIFTHMKDFNKHTRLEHGSTQ